MLDYIKRLVSSSPDASFARVSGALVLGLFMIQSCWCMWVRHSGIPDIPVNLLTLVLALYGCTKAGDIASAIGFRLSKGEGKDDADKPDGEN